MELLIEHLNKENIERLMPELIRLENNWAEIGEESWKEENFSKELDDKWELSLVAKVEEKIAGYLIGSRENNKANLNKILVDKDFRGMGIGKKLWLEFLGKCREKKLKRADFKVFPENISALNFYKNSKCLVLPSLILGKDKRLRYPVKYIFSAEKRITHSKPTIDSADMHAMNSAMLNNEIATGNLVNRFILEFSGYIGKEFGIAVNSGTNALYLALRALGIKENEEVILPSYVCSSVLSAVHNSGAKPVIVDINKDDFNISLKDTLSKISSRTKAIIIPHMFGNPVKDIEDFLKLGIPIIEDCAHSLGANLKGRKTGSFGDISVFSFYATKMMTTGYGGMVLTSNKEIYNKLKDLTCYDNRDSFGESYNFSISDFQAALGIMQLRKLDSFVKKRKEIAEKYLQLFNISKPDFELPEENNENIFFRFIIKHQDSDNLIKSIRLRGVDVSKPVFRPLHSYLNLNEMEFPNSEEAYKTSVSIPIYPLLAENEIEEIASILINWQEEKDD